MVKRKNPDQLLLRLPSGLKDRIRMAAESRGRSLSGEIVRVLEREYPEPWPLDTRVRELATLMSALRKVRGHEGAIDALTVEVLETVEAIANGRVPDIDDEVRKRVREALDDWFVERAENEQNRHDSFADDEEPYRGGPSSGSSIDLDDESGDK